MLKKTTLAVLGLAVNGVVLAGTAGPVCLPGDVTVPCEASSWDLGVQALYLKTLFSGQRGYAQSTPTSLRDINPDWDWGFRLEGSYHFSTGNDLSLSWIHYDAKDRQASFLGAVPVPVVGTIPSSYSLHTENKFDQINVVLGQYVHAGKLKHIRFYAGLQYADIRMDENHLFRNVPVAAINPVTEYRNSDFSGVGPVLGIDYSYDITDGLSVTANSSATILYGSSRYSGGYIYANSLMPVSFYGSRKTLVPGVEAKLGVNYAYAMPQGVLNLQGGYQISNYFHALESQSSLTQLKSSDYGLQGPYLGVKWLGHA